MIKSSNFAPKTLQDFATLRLQLPQARIVAGSTDVGLWVTKQGRDLGDMLYIGQVEELKDCSHRPCFNDWGKCKFERCTH